MVRVTKHGLLLQKRGLDYECEGVLNPGVCNDNGSLHLIYRAVARGNHSTLGYCQLSDPLTIAYQSDQPLLSPEESYDKHGVEDPRLVKIDDMFYLSYTAYDGFEANGCVALSRDLKTFERFGIVTPRIKAAQFRTYLANLGRPYNPKYNHPNMGDYAIWDKNLVFFPRRIDGKIAFLHRIRPGIQFASVSDLTDLTPAFWDNYMREFDRHICLDPKFAHELSYIGNGCPPIETSRGWLLIYHGVHDSPQGYTYVACAALLDIDDPRIEIARLPFPLFVPDRDWERFGYVDYVCFPTGSLVWGDELYIYYGAADERIAVASVNLIELLNELEIHKTPQHHEYAKPF